MFGVGIVGFCVVGGGIGVLFFWGVFGVVVV